MSFIAKWDNNEENMVLCLVRGDWTWGGFIELLQSVYGMIDTADHTVDIIVPGMEDVEYPSSDMVAELRRLRTECPPNLGMMVVVCDDLAARAMRDTLGRIYAHHTAHVEYVNTLDEARVLLVAARS